VEAILQAVEWGRRLEREKRLQTAEQIALCIGMAEYVAQLAGGIPMAKNEIFRPLELGLDLEAANFVADEDIRWLLHVGGAAATRRALIDEYRQGPRIVRPSQSTSPHPCDIPSTARPAAHRHP
jgi:(2S)-methylsuccinyl-CoA dehydrogenase